MLVCLVATLSYVAPKLEGALMLNPQTVWPLWPGCALLVAVLLLVPRKIWLILIPVALASFALYDLQAGVPLRSIAWFIPADTAQVLIAALCLNYFFDGVPQLNTVEALAKYLSFAVILAPLTAAFISAPGIGGSYWSGWGISFFSEVLAFLTVTPAVLSWVSNGRAWLQKPWDYHLEAGAVLTGLTVLAYINFTSPFDSTSPALLFSLVPLLLWSALRFASIGTSSAVIIVALLSIWGAVHGRGPFIERGPVHSVFALQLFLISTAIPFMVLAALVEERKTAEEVLRTSEERFRLAARGGKMFAYEWDPASDVIVLSGESAQILGTDGATRITGREVLAKVHPDDRERLKSAIAAVDPENPKLQITYRMRRPDGNVIWVERISRAHFDEQGRMLRMIGMVADVTKRQETEEALHQREKELLEAQRVSQVGSWQWNPVNDEVVWSTELYRIAGRDPNLPPPAFEEQTKVYTPESWDQLKRAIAEALRSGEPYTLDLEIVRPDGTRRWITDRGEVLRDGAGRITRLRGTAQDITDRKHAEDELRASEEKFRSVFRDAGVGMVIVSPEGRFLAANEAFCGCLGYAEEELLQKTAEFLTLPEDWPAFSRKLREALEQGTGFQRVEKRCLHKSGRIVTTESSGSLIRGPSGEPLYFVGEVLDVTQRKLAEEALSSVNRRLIEAQEQERTRVARELHDDINQRIGLLALSLSSFTEELHAVARHKMEELKGEVSRLATDIGALSHRLHSSKLEYLGLAMAAASFCRELSEQQKVKIDLNVTDDFPKAISWEISLCLFRVLQEALQNATKHSGARNFEVSLSYSRDILQLMVRDSGVGFDPDEATVRSCGVGLTSMRERLRLVDGQLTIDSRRQIGTTIHARVPLNHQVKSAGAAA
jgi:PAS domain S-box-containing protein